MKIETILENVPNLAQEFAARRDERQRRKEADPADYRRLQDLGIHLMAVPTDCGGTWESLRQSARPLCTVLRTVAHGDPSVALASAMHPLVLSPWRVPEAPQPYTDAWAKQRKEVYESVLDGAWWGTIVSEPGSGGDVAATRSVARPLPESDKYLLSGQKHFGSGSGVTSFMTTRAIPEGESAADSFFMEVRNNPWDGSTGMRLTAPWAGHGMSSTNSHAFEFKDFPATRVAWQGSQREQAQVNMSLGGMAFTAVVVGVVDAAMDYMRQRLKGSMAQGSALRAYQQVEWTYAQQEMWLIDQAFEGAVRAFDNDTQTRHNSLLAKESIAGLAESLLTRLCKIGSGSAYTWYSPLGAWFEDVRALGYLRPPWSLAFDQLFEMSWQE
jgi:alkylation response protein AidB-like acyl-CoA dehydrogenase